MTGHAVEPTQGVDIFEAVIDRGDLAQINLGAVARCEQYDLLEIFSVVSLTACLDANIAVLALDRTGGKIQRGGLNRSHYVVERKVVPA